MIGCSKLRHVVLASSLVFTLANVVHASEPTQASPAVSPERRARADALFAEGREHLAQADKAQSLGDAQTARTHLTKAAELFSASLKLDAATGTLLNLAVCHERLGLFATAFRDFQRALAESRRAAREDRIEFALQHLAAIQPKLPRLTLVVDTRKQPDGLVVEISRKEVPVSDYGAARAIDPGRYRVQARAPGFKSFEAQIEIAEAQQRLLVIPSLERLSRLPTAAHVFPPPDDHDDTARPVTVPVYIAGGVTLALASAAAVAGVIALERRSDYHAVNNSAYPVERRIAAHDAAENAATISTAFGFTALAGAGVTAYLFFSRPHAKKDADGARLSPLVTKDCALLSLSGKL